MKETTGEFSMTVVTIIAVVASSESTDTKKTVGKSLGILGMAGAGKTLFLRNLQGKPYKRCDERPQELKILRTLFSITKVEKYPFAKERTLEAMLKI